jgi:hypothetical protein
MSEHKSLPGRQVSIYILPVRNKYMQEKNNLAMCQAIEEIVIKGLSKQILDTAIKACQKPNRGLLRPTHRNLSINGNIR